MSSQRPQPRRRRDRGDALVVAHCAVLTRVTASRRAPVSRRLEARLGSHLAHVLVRGLSGDHPHRRATWTTAAGSP